MSEIDGKIIKLMRLRDVRQEGDLLVDSFRVSIIDSRHAGTVKEITNKKVFESECRISISQEAVIGGHFKAAMRELKGENLKDDEFVDLFVRFLCYRLLAVIFDQLDSNPGDFNPEEPIEVNIEETSREEVFKFIEHLETIPKFEELKRWSTEIKWVPDVDWSDM